MARELTPITPQGTSLSLVPAWDFTAWLLRGQIPAWSDVEPPNHSLGYRAHRRRRQLTGRCPQQRGHIPEDGIKPLVEAGGQRRRQPHGRPQHPLEQIRPIR